MNELTLHNLAGGIGSKKIVNGVSLRIRAGELHVLMGPNGSGKSTLAYLLMGHPAYSLTGGYIRLNGRDVTKASADEHAKCGLFLGFQQPPEFDGLDLTQLLLSATRKTNKKAFSFIGQIETEAARLGVKDLYRPINKGASGGEKKINEILQLSVLNPKFAILDEPDSGLDVDALVQVASVINELAKRSGLLIITHHSRILRYMNPTAVHILKSGKIVKSGDGELAKQIEEHGYDDY